MLCFATDIHLLLLSRALQGLSAAIVYTVGFALLADTVGSKNLGEWMGYNIMSVNIGITASPTIGGVLYDQAGYYSIFTVIAVLIAVDILLRVVLVEKRTAAEWMEEDIHTGENAPTQYGTFEPVSAGPSQQENPSTNPDSSSSERHKRSRPSSSNTSTIKNARTRSETWEPVTAGPSRQKDSSTSPERHEKSSPTRSTGSTPTKSETVEPVSAGPSIQKDPFAHFIDPPSERRETSPSTSNASIKHHDLRDDITGTSSTPALFILLSSPRILADLYASFVVVGLLASFDSALPIFLERTFGWGSTGAGLIFFTITLPILGAPVAGKVTDRYHSHWIPAIGFIIVGVLTALLQLIKYDSARQVALLISLLTLNGIYHA